MNIKENILEMDKIYASENDEDPCEKIEDLFLTFIAKFQIFEPSKYISEDDDWVTFILTPPDDSLESQIMKLRKEEILGYGICRINNFTSSSSKPKVESDALYQWDR